MTRPDRARATDNLLCETIDVGEFSFELNATSVEIHEQHHDGSWSNVVLGADTRQEANQLSIALKRAARRIEAIGRALPEGRPQG